MDGICFLRRLINFEGGILEDGRQDLGWCCSEHSLVASVAFCALGIKAYRCRGKVLIGDLNSRTVFDVFPHDFVLLETPRLGIFDSSVTFDSISGIPMGFASAHPNLGVSLFCNKKPPTQTDWKREMQQAKKNAYALYAVQKKMIPNEPTIKFKSSTPFGKWLSSEMGTQDGLWGKAAWCAAEVLAGRSPFEFEGTDRAGLWKLVANTPNQDDFIANRLQSFI